MRAQEVVGDDGCCGGVNPLSLMVGSTNKSIVFRACSFGILWRCGVIDPIFGAGAEVQVWVIFEFDVKSVDSRCGRRGAEAEHVEVGHVVGDGNEPFLETLCIVEVEEFSAGELRGGLGGVGMQ